MGAAFPTTASIRPVNPILADRLVAWSNAQSKFIADRVLKPVKTSEDSGTVMTVGRASTFGDVSDSLVRAPKSGYAQALGVQLSNTTYQCEEYGRETRVDMRMIEKAGDPLDLKALESQTALHDLLIAKERRVASLLFNTSVFTTTVLAGGDQWSASTSDPIKNIDDRREEIHQSCGVMPNAIIFGEDAYWSIRKSAAILSYMSTGKDRQLVTDEALKAMLADFFGFSIIEVGLARYNSANQGQTFASSAIWGDYVWVGVLDGEGANLGGASIGIKPTAAMQVTHTGLTSEEYEDNAARSVVIRHREICDELVIDASAGRIISDTRA